MAKSFAPGSGKIKRENLIGKRFGKDLQLIVIAFLGKKNKKDHWLVYCNNCNNEYSMRRDTLIGKKASKTCQKCGYKEMGKTVRYYLEGNILKSGSKVLSFSGLNETGRCDWKIQCGKCKKIFIVDSHRISTCPNWLCRKCSNIERGIRVRKYKTNDKIGNLKIIKSIGKGKYLVRCSCGKEYETSINILKRGIGYCFECANKIKGLKIRNPNISEEQRKQYELYTNIEHKKWAKKVYKKYDYKCCFCGKTHTKLNAHHLNGIHWFEKEKYNIDNGICLCSSCHTKYHTNSEKINTKEDYYGYCYLKIMKGDI